EELKQDIINPAFDTKEKAQTDPDILRKGDIFFSYLKKAILDTLSWILKLFSLFEMKFEFEFVRLKNDNFIKQNVPAIWLGRRSPRFGKFVCWFVDPLNVLINNINYRHVISKLGMKNEQEDPKEIIGELEKLRVFFARRYFGIIEAELSSLGSL